ncbi:TPA: helix-turn-helix transcriptional regulator [Listeria monocytogenes]|nr:XRE family transcriptional regulator [Listeria monocytogenes]EAC6213615.1 XRE family transcriptional regulator [Listeria monocytogenes]EAD3713473.1 XRE family transcriptional regulator [Listeria monocytogenes]EAD3727689.1 XRE family transcriptional regulator [Listeria monocytogenes]EAD3730208.1 XRE family transcriptional regulator [Listeria monocytogenes]
MKFSYNPLWKLLIDRGLNKAQLRKMTDISSATLSKLNKGENVTTDIILRICEALDCDLSDIVEIVRD